MTPELTTARAPSHLVVAGMHRSGTSLVASYLSALGVDMGEPIPADEKNPHGYFEDRDFLELNRQILDELTPEDAEGHRDWGWVESEEIDLSRLDPFRDQAQALFDQRSRQASFWGCKDPRASLLLDFWDDVVGDEAYGGRYLLLYRYPWDVADSMQRLGEEVFLEHPEYAYRIWTFYNRHLLRFYLENRDRCVLASTNALIHQPGRLVDLMGKKLGLSLGQSSFQDLVDPEAFVVLEDRDPLIALVAATSPDCVRLLQTLDSEADLSAAERWHVPALEPVQSGPGNDATPDLTVIIPCFDHGQFMIEAIASVERCVAPSEELIIINDGSTQPRTLEILGILRAAGYHVIDQENHGLAATRNRGIEAARGRYILPLDADNRLLEGFAAAAVLALDESPDVGVIYGSWREFGGRSGLCEPSDFDLEQILHENYIDACAVFRKELWADVGGYDTALPAWEDWEFWIHAAERSWRFQRLERTNFDYRVRPRSLVRMTDDPQVAQTIARHFVAKHRDLYRRHFRNHLGLIAKWVQTLEDDRSRFAQDREVFQWELSQRKQDLLQSRQRVAEVEAARSTLGQELAQELARNEEQLVRHEEQLARREEHEQATVTAFGRQLDAVRGELDELRGEVDVLRGELGQRSLELAAEGERAAKAEASYAELCAQWDLRESEAEILRQELERIEAQHAESRAETDRRERLLDAVRGEVAQQEKKLAAAEAERDTLRADTGHLEASLDTLLSDLTEAREVITQHQQQVLKARQETAQQRATRRGLELALQQREQELQQQAQTVARQQQELAQVRRQSAAQQAALAQIHSTFGWRLLQATWGWIDRLAPSASFRRRLWNRGLRVFKG
ncbi:MAG: glycosyltransferase [Acidobacteriota bacterium]